MIRVEYVVVLIIRRHGHENQLLIALRAAGNELSETWQLIWGGLESGEPSWEGGAA